MYFISHVAISVTDLERSISFYKKFGFSVVKEWRAEDLSIQITHLKLGNIVVELFCYNAYIDMPDASKTIATDLPIIGVKHFAFGVNDISVAYHDLIDKGIITDEIRITTGRLGKKYFFIKDPDGILIEVIE